MEEDTTATKSVIHPDADTVSNADTDSLTAVIIKNLRRIDSSPNPMSPEPIFWLSQVSDKSLMIRSNLSCALLRDNIEITLRSTWSRSSRYNEVTLLPQQVARLLAFLVKKDDAPCCKFESNGTFKAEKNRHTGETEIEIITVVRDGAEQNLAITLSPSEAEGFFNFLSQNLLVGLPRRRASADTPSFGLT